MVEGVDFSALLHKINRLNQRTWNEYTQKECLKGRLINKTGSPSVYGEIIRASSTTDFAFELTGVDDDQPIGIVYEAGIADGSLCWFVQLGSAQVLLKNGVAAAPQYWMKCSSVAGRADVDAAGPPGFVASHFFEIGHCIETITAGTDKLCELMVHFN